mmetsp:Transcript_9032/g.16439  ORF Transcript_9032/g.16439 Transcript_9032/m.16439 type:complete len:103 (+) Transcript_9032:93-401(+)
MQREMLKELVISTMRCIGGVERADSQKLLTQLNEGRGRSPLGNITKLYADLPRSSNKRAGSTSNREAVIRIRSSRNARRGELAYQIRVAIWLIKIDDTGAEV